MCVPLVRAWRDITMHLSGCSAEELSGSYTININVEYFNIAQEY